jgi:hypothetical protein
MNTPFRLHRDFLFRSVLVLMQNQDEAGEKNSTKINMTRPPTERAVAEGLVENRGVNIAFLALRRMHWWPP